MTTGAWLALCLITVGGLIRLVQHLRKEGASQAITGLSPRPATTVDGQLILHALEQSPWAVLAAQEGWPMHSEIMMGAVGRLDIQLPEAGASLSVSGHAGAAPGPVAHVTLRMPTPDPGAALRDRSTVAGLMTQLGRPLDPDAAQTWLSELPGPQGLSYLKGQLTLALPLNLNQLDEALAGLQDLARALELSGHPPWAALALEQGWALKLSPTGPSMTAQLRGFEIHARLQGQTERRRCILRCSCPAGVPPMTLNHIEHGHGEPEAVPHLIANTLLHIRALDPVALGQDLHDERLFQAILTVVHGYPGSSLTQQRIELVSPDDLGVGLQAAIHAVADLAAALEEHAWTPT